MTLWITRSNNTLAGHVGSECRPGNWLLLSVYVMTHTLFILCWFSSVNLLLKCLPSFAYCAWTHIV